MPVASFSSVMPGQPEIVEGLSRIANEFLPLAVVWHIVVATVLVALARGAWRPGRRAAAALLALPLLSASAAAWMTGNMFNGALLLVVAGALVIAAAGESPEPARRGPTWAAAVGSAAIAFAWVYPHFLSTHAAWAYLFAAPIGLVPCPTLLLVLGFGLMAGGFGSRMWSLTAAIAGLFYALFGMFRLGVSLDAGLLFASVAMFVAVPRSRHRAESARAGSMRTPSP